MSSADSFDRKRSSAIGHRSMTICNPLSELKIDRLLDGAQWREGMRVLDLGCGKGAWLAALAKRGKFTLVGVDRNPLFLEQARHLVPDAQFIEGDYEPFLKQPDLWDLILCVGGGQAFCGDAPLLERLGNNLAPGGRLIVADGFWRETPAAEYLERLGAEESDMVHACDLEEAIASFGWTLEHMEQAESDEWEAYELAYNANLVAFAAENPDDPELEALLAHADRLHTCYRRWGHFTLGFAAFRLRKS